MGWAAYVLFLLAVCHYGVVESDTEINRVIAALDHMTAHPFSFFPIDWDLLSQAAMLGLVIPLLFHAEYLKKRDLRPSVESGSAKWNEDINGYNKKYAECTYVPEIFLSNPILKPMGLLLSKLDDVVQKIPVIKIIWNNLKVMLLGKFAKPDETPRNKNMIFSKEIYMSMNGRKTLRNNNVMVIGGSGTGKSRYVVKPNILQANCSYVITDPSGELLETMGSYLQREGYEVRVFNLVQMEHSNCYNPFHYIRNDEGVLTMINALIKNTTPKGSSSNDPFWEKAETALLQALSFFLVSECAAEERNFTNVMKLLRCAEVKEGQEDYASTLDILFKELEERDPEHIAVRQYRVFKQAAGKTAQSILVSCSVRLAVFNLKVINKLTGTDDIDLGTLGDKKTALFCITPTADTTFNFLISLLYTQLFETLYHKAETKCKGKRLPVHVRFLLDEFSNIGTIPDFAQKLSTMRKYEISCTIILQALSQIKALYKDDWEVLIGNCDEFLFLGGSDATTLEYISKKLGKETIRSINNSRSYGRQGSYSISHNKAARELMTPDELNVMDNGNCILFIRGLYPFFCKKYDLVRHPAYKYCGDADDKYLFDVAKLINTGEKVKKEIHNRRPIHVIRDIEQSDGRESERQMHRNIRSGNLRSLKNQELAVVKPLRESAEDIANITSQYIREEYERNMAENAQENTNLEKIIEHQGGSVLSPSEEFIYSTYGVNLEDIQQNFNVDF